MPSEGKNDFVYQNVSSRVKMEVDHLHNLSIKLVQSWFCSLAMEQLKDSSRYPYANMQCGIKSTRPILQRANI